MGWIREEFEGVDFGDKRLTERMKVLGQALYEKPTTAIPEACNDWSGTKAAYRFFDNERVEVEQMLVAHREKTVLRMRAYETILAVQDTTFFNYDNHESVVGLGNIHSNAVPVKGLLAHNMLITAPNGLPLGLFAQKVYARKNKKQRSPHYSGIEAKESVRWIENLQCLAQSKGPNQKCITVGDREADIFELMHACGDLGLDFIIRSTHDRAVGTRKRRWGAEKGTGDYLLDFVEKLESQGVFSLQIEDKILKKERCAKLELRYAAIELPAPWRLDYGIDGPSKKNPNRASGTRLKVSANVVEVREVNPPRGAQKLHWRLLTSLPVANLEDAKKILEFYKARWTIEIYHRVLKSGCLIEARRLETFDRLERCITLYSIIAWRLLFMTRQNQLNPESPCTEILSSKEWQTLCLVSSKSRTVPKQVPSTRQAIHSIAKLGGFLARKSDGQPGITTIWRGWQRLTSYLELDICG